MSETKSQSWPGDATGNILGDDPFTALARMLAADEPHSSPGNLAAVLGSEKPRADHHATSAFKCEMGESSSASLSKAKFVGSEANTDTLAQRIEALEAENERLRQSLVRKQAEFDQVRQRYERERETIKQQSQADLLQELLTLMDGFECALGKTMAGPVGEDFVANIVQAYKYLSELLERHGVALIEATGEIFDPDFHEAVVIEARPGYETHTVIAELEKGYTVGQRLLRPARVKIATRP